MNNFWYIQSSTFDAYHNSSLVTAVGHDKVLAALINRRDITKVVLLLEVKAPLQKISGDGSYREGVVVVHERICPKTNDSCRIGDRSHVIEMRRRYLN